MATGAKICPFCGKLNARDDRQCVRCGRRMPGQSEAFTRDLVSGWLGSDFPMTKLMLLASAVVYAGMYLASQSGENYGPVALRWGALNSRFANSPWRYLSAMFVHFGLLHIGFNSLMLYQIGRSTEEFIGSTRFVVLFLISGALGFVAGDVWSALTTGGAMVTTGGLSGGLFGLFGIAAGWRWAEGDPAWKRLAMTGGLYALFTVFMMPSGVNHAAHFGGLLSGLGLGAALYRWGRSRRYNRAFGVAATTMLGVAFFGVAMGHRFY